MIPREGGNRASGNFRMNYRPGQWLGDNFTPRNYQSGNYANTAGTYLVPNGILLGRVVGLGLLVRW